ncbi:unnamed protein product [Dracunculus medinensis]|uniref:DNA_MISMATCH_REPAIR_2 domain-containing protein n=1 Tax=Dracunculus medinensis TaxID=318479 RepID=A0A0N4U3R2_DRAME|nr:unnamed protein product [Dracunculus medinensis]
MNHRSDSATANSLVIIDELGRGTSTYDGFGLAWAIADDLLSRVKCFCIFATHFHEMTDLQALYPNALKNIRVETRFDDNGLLILLYKVVYGVADRSFGLNIAKLVGLPDSVLESANVILNDLENREVDYKAKEDDLISYLKTLRGEQLREEILANLAPS